MAFGADHDKSFLALDEDLRMLFYAVVTFCDKLPVVEEPPVKTLPEGKDDGAGAAVAAGKDDEDSDDEDSDGEGSDDEGAEKIVLPECLVLFTRDGGVREEILKFCSDSFNAFREKKGMDGDRLNECLFDLAHCSVNINKKYSRLFSFFVSVLFDVGDGDVLKVPLYYLQNDEGNFYASFLGTLLDHNSFEESINELVPVHVPREQFEYYIELCKMRKIHTFINEKGSGVVSEEFNTFHSKYGFEFVWNMIPILDYLQDVPEKQKFSENERESALHGVVAWIASFMKSQGFGSKDFVNDVNVARTVFNSEGTVFEESAENVARKCDVGDDVIEYLSGVPDDELGDVLCHDPLAGMRAEEAAKAAKAAKAGGAGAAEAAGGAGGAGGTATAGAAEAGDPPSDSDTDPEPSPSKVARVDMLD